MLIYSINIFAHFLRPSRIAYSRGPLVLSCS